MYNENKNIEPLLVNATNAARLIGVGKTLFYSMNSTGKIPAPIVLNRRRFWQVEVLKRWVSAGCPSRDSAEWLENARRGENPDVGIETEGKNL